MKINDLIEKLNLEIDNFSEANLDLEIEKLNNTYQRRKQGH